MAGNPSGMTPSESTAEIAGLLDRYLITLDDEKLDDDWTRSLFTEDASVTFPVGGHQGAAGMGAFHQRTLDAFTCTQHMGTHAFVEIEGGGGTARLRANCTSTHVHRPENAAELGPLFRTGTFVDGRARRTPEGWRLSALSFRLMWKHGTPPGGGGR